MRTCPAPLPTARIQAPLLLCFSLFGLFCIQCDGACRKSKRLRAKTGLFTTTMVLCWFQYFDPALQHVKSPTSSQARFRAQIRDANLLPIGQEHDLQQCYTLILLLTLLQHEPNRSTLVESDEAHEVCSGCKPVLIGSYQYIRSGVSVFHH